MEIDESTPDPSRPPMIGRVLRAKYRILRRIGAGGWGSVFEAEHLLLRRRVAIKLLHPSFVAEPHHLERFRREAIAASRIGHPGIVQVLDIDRSDEGLEFIVLELLEGESLRARLSRERRFDWRFACELLLPIVDALAAAHRAGIVHRDLKPDNVFLCYGPEGRMPRPKLLDFGVAKVASRTYDSAISLTTAGALLGTPAYMAPEQIRGDREIDARTDLYGLGVVLYELVTGRLPFWSENFADLVEAVLQGPVRPLVELVPGVPNELSSLVASMMDREPRRRPSSSDLVRAALARLAAQVPVAAAVSLGEVSGRSVELAGVEPLDPESFMTTLDHVPAGNAPASDVEDEVTRLASRASGLAATANLRRAASSVSSEESTRVASVDHELLRRLRELSPARPRTPRDDEPTRPMPLEPREGVEALDVRGSSPDVPREELRRVPDPRSRFVQLGGDDAPAPSTAGVPIPARARTEALAWRLVALLAVATGIVASAVAWR